uniref:RING-type domain-containing protein n=1 Tax=Compsopogon caeruleus TaxID=31354 RepID=A0A7S1XGG1_9RHOD
MDLVMLKVGRQGEEEIGRDADVGMPWLGGAVGMAAGMVLGQWVGSRSSKWRRRRATGVSLLRRPPALGNISEQRMETFSEVTGEAPEAAGDMAQCALADGRTTPGKASCDITREGDRRPADEIGSDSPLDCPICLNSLVIPKLVPCGHTLCAVCILSLYEIQNRPSCPVCRNHINVPFEDLPTNFLAQACVESVERRRGQTALAEWKKDEEDARCVLTSWVSGGKDRRKSNRPGFLRRFAPAWTCLKWTMVLVTEVGAVLLRVKDVVDARTAAMAALQSSGVDQMEGSDPVMIGPV